MSGNIQSAQAHFAIDIKDHIVKIIHDDGVNRHIICQKADESSVMRFDLITYKGGLVYRGDMGTYVFERIDDMFRFFGNGGRDGINPSYWGEKLTAVDRHAGYRKFDLEVFRKTLAEAIEEKQQSLSEADSYQFGVDVLDESSGIGDEYDAVTFVRNYRYVDRDVSVDFDDFFQESNVDAYSYRYAWCCFAIVWGIQQYRIKAKAVARAKRRADAKARIKNHERRQLRRA